jgi:hypothetical protein
METGYRLEAVTVRKLEFENDAFAFGDKVIEKWYPTVEEGGKKGILVLVTSGKDGSLTGGPAFMKVLPPRSHSGAAGENWVPSVWAGTLNADLAVPGSVHERCSKSLCITAAAINQCSFLLLPK